MRDPAGVPAHPFVFELLMVLTWTAHIAFVLLAIGTAGLAISAFHQRYLGPHWVRLSMAMTKAAKVSVSLLIVLGVGPLLFTQTIYDPQWYTSNVLSGRWAIAFILSLIVAYCCWFAFYHSNHPAAKGRIGIYAWIALGLLCLDGLIMHVLAYQALLPNRWMDWYAPDGFVDTKGSRLHAVQWPRYFFLMSLSAPTLGVFLLAYTHYFSVREGVEVMYLDFVRALGRRISVWGFSISILPMLAWLFDMPQGSGLEAHPVGWIIVAAIAAMALWIGTRGNQSHGYLPAGCGVSLLGVLSIWREIIRVRYLRPFGYDIGDYPVHADWPSTVLFFATLFGVGGGVSGFYLMLLYRAGRKEGMYKADRVVSHLGTGAISILGIWIVVFFAYGIFVSIH